MTDLRSIERRYRELAHRLGAPKRHVQFSTDPRDDGGAHLEWSAGAVWYVVTERGIELERRCARDEDEALYWILGDLVRSMALEWELEHRREKEDFRRQYFAKAVELFGLVSPEWAERQRREFDDVLAAHPFSDAASSPKSCSRAPGRP